MVRPSDDGGSSYTSVDPGQIRKFAELLDGITDDVSTGPKRQVDSAPTGHEMFGAFNDASTRAQSKHDEMVTDSRTFWTTMHQRLGNVAAGTHQIATRYTDLAGLNETSATEIQAALAAGTKKV